jgi:uncharacterized protein YdaU (DUF1376 family)
MSDNWYKRDVRKAIDGMRLLTPEERGCYNTLIDYQYLFEGPLHDDDRYIAGLMGCDVRVWKRIKKQLLDKQRISLTSDGRIEDLRASHELASRYAQRSQRVASGHLGGIASGKAKKTKVNGEAHASLPFKQIREEEIREEEIREEEKDIDRGVPNGTLVARGDVTKAFENYNRAAERLGLSKATTLTPDRKRKLEARLKEHGLKGWNAALNNLCDQPFCLGQSDRGWKASFDFLLQPTSLNKVLEKAYAHEGDLN